MTSTLTSSQLHQLSQDLAEIAQRYNQSPAASLLLRQHRTTEDGGDVLYIVGEDAQGKEWVAVRITLAPASTGN